MKKFLPLFLSMSILFIHACAPLVTADPSPLPATEPTATVGTQTPIAVTPTDADQSAIWKLYTNSPFELSFQYPSNWFGPDEYVSDQTLRVSVGSDVVYPYGTDLEGNLPIISEPARR